jgi:broad specificity phosphatase PhoE
MVRICRKSAIGTGVREFELRSVERLTETGSIRGLPTLYLVRHGETEWSRSGRHTGRTDIPLTAHGEEMARELAPLLKPVHFATVLTSPRLRAMMTCALSLPGAEAIIEPDLAEWDYGDYEGMLTSKIRKRHPGWNAFHDGCPGGETLAQIVARADRLLLRVKTMPSPIAMFSHGHFGSLLAVRWADLGGEAGRHLALDPASISILGPKPGDPEVPMILRWNCVTENRL